VIELPFDEEDLPEVILNSDIISSGYAYVKAGTWSFCVQDDLEHGSWWDDVKALIAYAQYLDKAEAKRGEESAVE
jgi:hypothetical protein